MVLLFSLCLCIGCCRCCCWVHLLLLTWLVQGCPVHLFLVNSCKKWPVKLLSFLFSKDPLGRLGYLRLCFSGNSLYPSNERSWYALVQPSSLRRRRRRWWAIEDVQKRSFCTGKCCWRFSWYWLGSLFITGSKCMAERDSWCFLSWRCPRDHRDRCFSWWDWANCKVFILWHWEAPWHAWFHPDSICCKQWASNLEQVYTEEKEGDVGLVCSESTILIWCNSSKIKPFIFTVTFLSSSDAISANSFLWFLFRMPILNGTKMFQMTL